MNIKHQLRKLYHFEFFNSISLTSAVWVVLLISRGYNLAQVGIAEGVFHIVSFICEIPSGVLSDLIGRKRMMVIAGISSMVSAVIMAFCSNFGGICVSMGFSALGFNLLSGTREALTYDSLVSVNQAERYLKVSAVQNIVYQVTTAISGLGSAGAILLGYKKAYLVSAGLAIFSILIALSLEEPAVTEKQKRRQKVPAWGAAVGLKAHLSVCRDFLRQHPKAIALMLACGWISAASYLTFMFMQEHLIETGIPPFYIGIPLWIVQMTGTAGILIAARYRAGTVNFTGICAVCAGFGIILAGFKALHLSVAGFIVVEAANSAVNLQSMNVLNNMLPSDQRASLVSVQSLIYSSFMLAGSPVLGLICKTFGIAAGFTMTGGLLAASAVIMYVIYTKRLKKMTSLFRNADR